jgi:hypothetical protein
VHVRNCASHHNACMQRAVKRHSNLTTLAKLHDHVHNRTERNRTVRTLRRSIQTRMHTPAYMRACTCLYAHAQIHALAAVPHNSSTDLSRRCTYRTYYLMDPAFQLFVCIALAGTLGTRLQRFLGLRILFGVEPISLTACRDASHTIT